MTNYFFFVKSISVSGWFSKQWGAFAKRLSYDRLLATFVTRAREKEESGIKVSNIISQMQTSFINVTDHATPSCTDAKWILKEIGLLNSADM